MGAIIGVLFWGLVWGFATKAVIKNKGYTSNWFWWGFFFGFIAFIVALTKPDISQRQNIIINQQIPAGPVVPPVPQVQPVPQVIPQLNQTPQKTVPIVENHFVTSVSSQHRGCQYCVSFQPLIIGRLPSCGIVFADNTPGVSGIHCSIRWDISVNAFVLTDLGSSYGTFLHNGERLVSNVPYYLKIGDSFYLAEKKNTIIVSQ